VDVCRPIAGRLLQRGLAAHTGSGRRAAPREPTQGCLHLGRSRSRSPPSSPSIPSRYPAPGKMLRSAYPLARLLAVRPSVFARSPIPLGRAGPSSSCSRPVALAGSARFYAGADHGFNDPTGYIFGEKVRWMAYLLLHLAGSSLGGERADDQTPLARPLSLASRRPRARSGPRRVRRTRLRLDWPYRRPALVREADLRPLSVSARRLQPGSTSSVRKRVTL
jgi:hypothetical protein